jgi:hypothetical protein
VLFAGFGVIGRGFDPVVFSDWIKIRLECGSTCVGSR